MKKYVDRLTPVLGAEEAASVGHLVFEELLHMRRIDVVLRRSDPLSHEHQVQLMELLERLLRHEPVQYVLGKAHFLGREFLVDRSVLIPRPETEELVLWMLDCLSARPVGSLIDMGTGTGCIPITFSLECPGWAVHALDISDSALEVARSNAIRFAADVHFHKGDMTADPASHGFKPGQFACVVSNPPYIPTTEKATLDPRVRDYEPSLALFAPESDPLWYYRNLSKVSGYLLSEGGFLFLEVHASYADATAKLLERDGWRDLIVRNDIHGKERMIRCTRP